MRKKEILLGAVVIFLFVFTAVGQALEFSGFADLRIVPSISLNPTVEQFEIDLAHSFGRRAEFNGAVAWDGRAMSLAVASVEYNFSDYLSAIIGQVDMPFTLSSTQYGSPDNPTPALPITNINTVDGLNDKIIGLDVHYKGIAFYPYLLDESRFGANLYFAENAWVSFLRLNGVNLIGASADFSFNRAIVQGELVSKDFSSYGAYAFIAYKVYRGIAFSVKPEFWSEGSNFIDYESVVCTVKPIDGVLFRFAYKLKKNFVFQTLVEF